MHRFQPVLASVLPFLGPTPAPEKGGRLWSGLEAPIATDLSSLQHGPLGAVEKQGFLLDPSRAAKPGRGGGGTISSPAADLGTSVMALWLPVSGTQGSLTLK